MASEHVVFTYHDPAALRGAAGAWLAGALLKGGGALLACEPHHAVLVRAELRAIGIDVERCETEGRLSIQDADTLLARFCVDGMPKGALFRPIARKLLSDLIAATGSHPIRIWGEMVDLLAQRGKVGAADKLESAWQEILREFDVQLLCTYNLEALDADRQARVLLDACSSHSEVVSDTQGAVDAAVAGALEDVFGPDDGRMLQRILPTRRALLQRMSPGGAALLSLRALHPRSGDAVAARVRARIHEASLKQGAPSLPRLLR